MGDSRPIGVFDSGVGGVTVLEELKKVLPNENYIYLGDTARVPYGNKSKELIIQYTEECVNFLKSKNVKLIVIACNTASSYGYDIARESAGDIPIIEMIHPASELALKSTNSGSIGVIGTKGTINYGAYEREIQSVAVSTSFDSVNITSIACPLFVPFIEEGKCENAALSIVAREYLEPMINKDIDTVIMGCTHYPYIINTLSNILGPNIELINTGYSAALIANELLNNDSFRNIEVDNKIDFYVTDSPELFVDVAQKNLGTTIKNISKITL